MDNRDIVVALSPMHVKKVSEYAITPSKATRCSAGYDLYSIDNTSIPPGGRAVVDTGVIVEILYGYYGRVAPRSGLAFRFGIDVLAGVIDSDYRGVVKVILVNHGKLEFKIKRGDRIAQLILTKIFSGYGVIKVVEHTTKTERGAGGFGSTGV